MGFLSYSRAYVVLSSRRLVKGRLSCPLSLLGGVFFFVCNALLPRGELSPSFHIMSHLSWFLLIRCLLFLSLFRGSCWFHRTIVISSLACHRMRCSFSAPLFLSAIANGSLPVPSVYQPPECQLVKLFEPTIDTPSSPSAAPTQHSPITRPPPACCPTSDEQAQRRGGRCGC